MVLAYNPNVNSGLLSGVEKLASAYLEKNRRKGIASGLKQINAGDWESGINTIAEINPEIALGLAQYKQDGLGGFGKTPAGLALSIAQNPNNYSPEMVDWAKNQLLANSVDYATQKAYETQKGKGKAQLEYEPELSREKAYQSGLGKSQAEREEEASDIERSYPALEDMTNKLINLADKATYTVAGQTRDWILRQAGLPMSEGGVAREEYKQTVANELIPQLKKMFGGQLSDAEREALLGTLGDVNLSPEEKKSAIKSFIETKRRQLKYNIRTEPQQTDIIDASEYFK